MASIKTRFWILIGLVTISGFSQGMLLPLIAIILEQNGVSSSLNGLHATGLYIGILIASPFMEKPLQKFGFKPLIIVGGMLVFISLALFPLWQALWFWFILRMMVGIGDQMLHFGTQTWITTTVTEKSRGKSISIYGLSFALGFTLGPLMTQLLVINEALPFIIAAIFSMFVWSAMFFVRNEWPTEEIDTDHQASSIARFIDASKIAWVALLPSFAFGFLESTLHGVFPIYGLRIGHDVSMLSLVIPCFAAASIISQVPLGILSDKFGRRKILLFILTGGILTFAMAIFLESSIIALFLLFALAGSFVGSLFSLSISYMVDLLPQSLLPAGNLMVGITFSLGSIGGPIIGGWFVESLPGLSFFYLIVGMLIFTFGVIYMKKDQVQVA